MFENVSSLASHFLEDKSSQAWGENNAAALQFIGVALLWDRLKSRCPQSFWVVGINRNEVFCVVCFLCPIRHNGFFIFFYFQEFNRRNQNKTLKAVKCCLIKYVCLCSCLLPGARCSGFPEGERRFRAWNNKHWLWKFPTSTLTFSFFLFHLWTGWKTWKVPFGFRTLRLDVRLLRPYKIEDDVAMETAGAAVAYGVPCR